MAHIKKFMEKEKFQRFRGSVYPHALDPPMYSFLPMKQQATDLQCLHLMNGLPLNFQVGEISSKKQSISKSVRKLL